MSTRMIVSLAAMALAPPLARASSYQLADDYNPSTFYSGFTFFTDPDPTQGLIKYVDVHTASSMSIAGYVPSQDNAIFLGVNAQNTLVGPFGASSRASTRVTSNKAYNHGLFIADISHMPGGVCSSWPAFWLLGPDWPTTGEIDIIENVNRATGNIATLHTSGGACAMEADPSAYTGNMTTKGCDIHSVDQAADVGCAVTNDDPASYGAGFNAAGGGIYATEWTSDHIAIWFFGRNSIPADLRSANTQPDPSTWGKPIARFAGGANCDIDARFKDMNIVINTALCGSWAGSDWKYNPECTALAPTCQEFVAAHASAFDEVYWTFNSIRVYQQH